jgi:predicted nucleic acid-binding protein
LFVEDAESFGQVIKRAARAFEILEFDDAAARLLGATTSFLQRIGKPAGDMDVLTAATAIADGRAFATRNARCFTYIPGLAVREC